MVRIVTLFGADGKFMGVYDMRMKDVSLSISNNKLTIKNSAYNGSYHIAEISTVCHKHVEYITIIVGKQVAYKWVASSDDGAFEDESKTMFSSKKSCYNNMRRHALAKMEWNTQYDEDFCDCDSIGYEVQFTPNSITHKSYSGVYTYQIVEVD